MSDFCAKSSVVHEQNVKIFGVVDYELFKTVWQEEFGGVIRAISDFRHLFISSETTTHSVIDTLSKK